MPLDCCAHGAWPFQIDRFGIAQVQWTAVGELIEDRDIPGSRLDGVTKRTRSHKAWQSPLPPDRGKLLLLFS